MSSDSAVGRAATSTGCPAHAGRTPLYGPEFTEEPQRVYAQLRHHGSVAPVELAPGVSATLVIGYDTALEVLRNPATFSKDPSSWQRAVPPSSPVLPIMGYRPNCQFGDGNEHARLREAITDSLGRVNPNALREHVEHTAQALINDFGPTGEADLRAEYAELLPLRVLIQLFGCPPDDEQRILADVREIWHGPNAEEADRDLDTYLRDLVSLKRERPGLDLTSWLMAHAAHLTDEEMRHQLGLFVRVGLTAEQNLITNALRLLLCGERFAGDLTGGTLPVEDALDEVLWTEPPLANYAMTYPTRDVDLARVRLVRDQPVVISLVAANTDAKSASACTVGNRAHLAFGAGPHSCPAQRLARLIASVALEQLLDRLPEMRLAQPADQLTWHAGPFQRALTALPVRFPPVAAIPLA